ncbi:MAG: NAD(P)-dependent oxidoreductase [Dongiaceae bacterium]
MKLALIGATGNVGAKILAEALDRGHQVTAIARNVEKLPARPTLTAKRGDVADQVGLAKLLAGHDAVISSVHFSASDPQKLIGAVKTAGVKRYVVVGGAGSLEVKPGAQLVTHPSFPAANKGEAHKGRDFLTLLRGEDELEWTFLSPSAVIAPGERTGKFRLGGDQLLVDGNGESKISQEDYAVALIDEVEQPRHVRRRFTVGY